MGVSTVSLERKGINRKNLLSSSRTSCVTRLSPLILKPSEMIIQEIKYKKGSGNHVTQRYATFEESGNLLVDLKFLTQPAKEFGTCLSVKVTTPGMLNDEYLHPVLQIQFG